MPTNKLFFPNLRPVKKVVTPQGEILIRKVWKCGDEFMGTATRTRCEKCLRRSKTEMKAEAARAVAIDGKRVGC